MPEPAPSALRPSVTAATPVAALAVAVGARLLGDDAAIRGVVVHGVEQRSNAVQAGDLFAALPGAKAHGATFASAAVQAGAVAVLTDEEGADIARALGVPILVHPAPRAVLGEVSATVYGHPSQPHAGHRRDRHLRQDHHELPDRGRARGRRPTSRD